MSSGRFAEVRTPLILSILMVLMTQIGYLDLMNAWSGDEETLDETTDVLETGGSGSGSGSSQSNFTASVEGADLIIDEAMTNITFQYDSSAVSGSGSGSNSGTYNGNGTAWMVKNIANAATSSFPDRLTAVGNTLFFKANNGQNGYELWKSNGTSSGTVMVLSLIHI